MCWLDPVSEQTYSLNRTNVELKLYKDFCIPKQNTLNRANVELKLEKEKKKLTAKALLNRTNVEFETQIFKAMARKFKTQSYQCGIETTKSVGVMQPNDNSQPYQWELKLLSGIFIIHHYIFSQSYQCGIETEEMTVRSFKGSLSMYQCGIGTRN